MGLIYRKREHRQAALLANGVGVATSGSSSESTGLGVALLRSERRLGSERRLRSESLLGSLSISSRRSSSESTSERWGRGSISSANRGASVSSSDGSLKNGPTFQKYTMYLHRRIHHRRILLHRILLHCKFHIFAELNPLQTKAEEGERKGVVRMVGEGVHSLRHIL